MKSTQSVGKNAAILTISNVITMLVTLMSTMLLSRFRTLEEYGTYSQLLIIVTMATSLFTLGLPNSTNFFLARAETPQERGHFLSVYYTLNTAVCAFMAIVVPLSIPLAVTYFHNDSIANFGLFLAIHPWAQVTISSISNVLVVYGKTGKLLVINLSNALVSLISIIIVQVLHWDFHKYIALFLIGEIAVTLYVYWLVLHLENEIRAHLDAKLIKMILGYSIPIGLAALVSTANIEIDKLMIGKFFDTETLAIYANSSKEMPFAIFASALTAVLLPRLTLKLAAGDKEGTVILWGNAIQLSYLVLCFGATMCIVFAPQIISLLYSEKYLPGTAVFCIYSLGILMKVTYFGMLLNATGKTKFVLYASVFSLGLNCILNYTLYLCFGMIGPAIATVLSMLVVGLGQLAYSAKIIGCPFSKIFPWGALLKITVINILLGLAGITTAKLLHIGTDFREIIRAIMVGICLLIVYLGITFQKIKELWGGLNQNS